MSKQDKSTVSRITSLEVNLQRLVELSSVAIPAPMVVVALRERNAGWFTMHAGSFGYWLETNGDAFFSCVFETLAESNRSKIVSNTSETSDIASSLLEELGAKAWVVAELSEIKHWHEGIICILDTSPRRWKDHDITRIDCVAAIAARLTELPSAPGNDIDNRVKIRNTGTFMEAGHYPRSREVASQAMTSTDSLREQLTFDKTQSENRYRSLFDLNWHAVFEFDAHGKFVDANPSCEALLGYHIHELLEMSFASVIAPEDLETATQAFANVLSGNSEVWEIAIRRRDGERRELQGTSVPVVINKEIVGAFGIAQDITEQKQFEEALRESEEKLRYQRSLLMAQGEVSPDGFMVVSADGRILSYNQRFMTMWGISSQVMQRGAILDARDAIMDKLVEPEAFIQRVQHLYAHPDEECHDEVELKDGRVFERHSSPVRSDDGRHFGRVWYYRDITEQKQAQRQLLEQTSQLESLVAQNPDLVARLDLNGHFLSVNQAFDEMLGYSPDDLIGLPFTSIVAKKNHAESWRAISQLAQGNAQSLEITVYARNGQAFELRTQGVPIIIAEEVVGAWGIGEDVTEKNVTEAKLRQSEARLAEAQSIAALGSWAWDLNTGNLSWSDETYRLFNIEPQSETPTFDRFLEMVHPDERNGVQSAVQTSMHEGAPYDIDITIVRTDGEQRIVNAQGEVTYDERGIPLRMAGTILDITERKHLENELAYLATHDPLTGLANRYQLTRQIERILASQPVLTSASGGILYIDLDDFKLVNDNLGHDAGDELLKLVAERLLHLVRAEDTVARLGGDEFIVLTQKAMEADHYGQLAERIIRSLKQTFSIRNVTISISPSIGIVTNVQEHEDPESILLKADHAMYRAKRRGKSSYEFFTSSMDELSRNLIELKTELRRAVDEELFSLDFQPIVRLGTGQPVGAEALIRWHSSNLGSISPAEFIPLAETSGFIGSIGNWVIRAASHQLLEWEGQIPGSDSLIMSVNLSPAQVRQRNFVQEVEDAILHSGIDPQRICFEITETCMTGLDQTERSRLQTLREFGILLAIDDFGTGNTSLSKLMDLPVDWLKVDRSFTHLLDQRAECTAILEAIVQLSHAIGVEVIAEGIETDEQLAVITELGFDLAQGFYIAMPSSPQQVLQFLKNQ